MSSVLAYAHIGRHWKKEHNSEVGFWKPQTRLDPTQLDGLKWLRKAYALDDVQAYCPNGFLRNIETAEILTGGAPVESMALNPLTYATEAEWRAMCHRGDGSPKTVVEMLIDSRDKLEYIGSVCANLVTSAMVLDKNVMLVLNGPILEATVAVLLNQWPLRVPVQEFEVGDFVKLAFDQFRRIVSFQYLTVQGAFQQVTKT